MNIGMNLILPETKSHWAASSPLIIWPVFIQIFIVDFEVPICLGTECVMAVQGHPRSLISVPIENVYVTSY